MTCSDSIQARYVLCFMLFLGFMTTFLLRANLNVAIVAMVKQPVSSAGDPLEAVGTSYCLQKNQTITTSTPEPAQEHKVGEFEWTEFQQSVILGSFFWGYLFFQVPGGRIAEVHGTKTVYGLALFINGVLCFFLPFAAKAHWTLLLLIRALQGLAQGVVFPALNAIVVRWVPLAERARFVSFAFQGASLGTVIAMPVCAWVLTQWGWESVFYFSGTITLLWSTAWYFLVFDTPAQHPRLSSLERSYLEKNLDPVAGTEEEENTTIPWKEVLRCRQFLVGTLAAIGSDWGFHTFFTLGPKYMKGALGFDLQKSSWLSSVPYLSQWVFAMIYGTVADQMTKGHVPLSVVRKISVGVSHLLPTFGLLLLSVSGCNVTMSVVVFTLSVTMIGAVTAGFFQMPMDIAPNFAGLLTGVMNGIGSVTAVVSTPLAGALLENSGPFIGWRYIFLVAAGTYLLGGLPYIIYYKAEVQPWNNVSSKEKEKDVSLNQISAAVQDGITKR